MGSKAAYSTALREFSALRDATDAAEEEARIGRMHDAMDQVEQRPFASRSGYVPYPGLDDPNFLAVVTGKREFRFDGQQEEQTCEAGRFRLSTAQKFVRNLISPSTPYKGIMLFHGVGVGKTCTAIQVAEAFRGVYVKPTLVITKPSLADAFRRQAFDPKKGASQCTGGRYLQAESVKSNYDVVSYITFGNNIEQKLAEGKGLAADYSKRVIIIDEVHNLRNVQNKGKSVSKAVEAVLQAASDVRLVLLTATPLYNDIDELKYFMRLLYMNDRRQAGVQAVDRADFSRDVLGGDDRRLLADFSRQYVSYVRGEHPGTFPARLWPPDAAKFSGLPTLDVRGERIPKESMIRLVPMVVHQLVGEQLAAYKAIRETEEVTGEGGEVPDEDNDQEEVPGRALESMLQVCNVALPRPPGKDGQGQVFGYSFRAVRGSNRLSFEYTQEALARHGEFLARDRIAHYSAKYAYIVRSVLAAKGAVLVHSRFLRYGLYPLAIALEHQGLVNASAPVLVNGRREKGTGMRYIMVVGEGGANTNEKSNERLLQMFNSPENFDGSVVKVALVSGVGGEGVDYKCVRELHVVEPWYNMSRIEQLIGRGVRNCSHSALPPQQRNCTIYLHATRLQDRETWDLYMYRMAEAKQLRISRLEHVIKRNAMDCHMQQRSRAWPTQEMVNSRGEKVRYDPSDVDYSRACDFQKCDPGCEGKRGGGAVDESSFDRSFVERDIEQYVSEVTGLFAHSVSYTYEQLHAALPPPVDDFSLSHALDRMIKLRLPVRFGSEDGRVVYRADRYLFQPTSVADARISIAQREASGRHPKTLRISRVSVQHIGTTNVQLRGADIRGVVDELATNVPADIPRAFLTDYVVDHLPRKAFESLCASRPDGDVLASLERGGVKIPEGYFNYFDGRIYDARFKPISDYMAAKAVTAMVQANASPSGAPLMGFVAPKKDEVTFKMIDVRVKSEDQLQGVACEFYPQLKKAELMALMSSRRPAWRKYLEGERGSRAQLCMLYELALRLQGSGFRRPVQYVIDRMARRGT
jgi:superfamily II DNA or RNA helicase